MLRALMKHILEKLSQPLALFNVTFDLDLKLLLFGAFKTFLDPFKFFILLKALKFKFLYLFLQGHHKKCLILLKESLRPSRRAADKRYHVLRIVAITIV